MLLTFVIITQTSHYGNRSSQASGVYEDVAATNESRLVCVPQMLIKYT